MALGWSKSRWSVRMKLAAMDRARRPGQSCTSSTRPPTGCRENPMYFEVDGRRAGRSQRANLKQQEPQLKQQKLRLAVAPARASCSRSLSPPGPPRPHRSRKAACAMSRLVRSASPKVCRVPRPARRPRAGSCRHVRGGSGQGRHRHARARHTRRRLRQQACPAVFHLPWLYRRSASPRPPCTYGCCGCAR